MLMIEVMDAHSIVLRPVVSSEQLKVLRLLVDQAEPLTTWDGLQAARPHS